MRPLTFRHDNHEYALSFKRDIPNGQSKPATTARLSFLCTNCPDEALHNDAPHWIELMRATVRCYFRDTYTKEQGRRIALQRLTPYVAPALRPILWATYFSRKESVMKRVICDECRKEAPFTDSYGTAPKGWYRVTKPGVYDGTENKDYCSSECASEALARALEAEKKDAAIHASLAEDMKMTGSEVATQVV